MFARVGKELQERGIKVNTGTIVDATIIGAPSSTKNAEKARDNASALSLMNRVESPEIGLSSYRN